MSLINNFGPENSPIWILLDEPYKSDAGDNIILSGGLGYVFKKIWRHAGIPLGDVHIRSLRPCLGASYVKENILSNLLADLDRCRPAVIVPLSDEIINYLVPETTQAKEKNSSLMKWAGSLLQSKYLSYPHYVIGSFPPDWVQRNWAYNEIQATIDFGHVREEFEYFKKNGTINPLPRRNLYTEPTYTDLIGYLNDCLGLAFVSVDIETLRPKGQKGKKNNTFYFGKNCGYPYTIALAKNPNDAMSFSLWDYEEDQCLKIWRLLDKLLNKVPQIGQNYFLFDAHYLKALGFRCDALINSKDTLIEHHILWPSLKHSLQFQTKQYTRETFYKDEGRNFNIKQKKKFMIYNAKDAAVTYEIWECHQEEFAERKYLI